MYFLFDVLQAFRYRRWPGGRAALCTTPRTRWPGPASSSIGWSTKISSVKISARSFSVKRPTQTWPFLFHVKSKFCLTVSSFFYHTSYFLKHKLQMLNGCDFTVYPCMLYQLHVKASLLKQLTIKYFSRWKKLPQTMTLFKLGVIVNDTQGIGYLRVEPCISNTTCVTLSLFLSSIGWSSN